MIKKGNLNRGKTAENKGKIYYYDKEIAPNLVDLLEQLMEDDTFYYDLIYLEFFWRIEINTDFYNHVEKV